MQEERAMPGNYRYEEERHRGPRGATRRGFGERGREDDDDQEQQTERFGRGPDYEREGGQGERTWGSSRRQYGYDEGFTRGNRSLGRGSTEGYDDEETTGGEGSRDAGRQYRGYGQERYGQRGFNQDFEQGSYGRGGYQAGGFQQGGYQGGYQQGGYGQGQQPRSQYGQSGYTGQSRGTEGSRYGGSQADGWSGEPDEMRWGRQQGLYGSSEYGGFMSTQRSQHRSQSDFQSHVGKGPKNWQRSDERIREDVNEALARHPEIDASDIEVKVQNCEITLTGTVADRRAKREAEDVAERVFGVKDVQNQIRVKPDGQDASTRDRTTDRELSRSTERESRTQTDPQSSTRTPPATGTNVGNTAR
jgi:osmotically-inducible protein OsmY